MENILSEINSVIGVVGSFVCLSDGTIAAQAMPVSIDVASVELAARIVSQTFQALEISGQRAGEAELVYDKSRLVLRNLRGGLLAILCSRTINVPLLSFTANQAVKKLAAEIRLSRSISETVQDSVASSVPRESAQTLERKAAHSPLLRELEKEVQRLEDAARENSVTLRVLDSLAIWLCCPNTHTLVALPDKRQIEFAAPSSQQDSALRLFKQAGYENIESLSDAPASRHLHLVDAGRKLNVEVFFDVLELDHRLDLTLLLHQVGGVLSPTLLLLTRLQILTLSEVALRETCALLRERDVSMESLADKISASQIAEYCLNDPKLAQTILKNLDQVAAYAPGDLAAADQAIVVERARRLSRSINTSLLLLMSHSSSSSWRAH